MAAINNSQIYFSSKLTSFVPENRKKLRSTIPIFSIEQTILLTKILM
jgi:hypothetical protein